MKTLPQIIFIVDPIEEGGALSEARKLGIPVVAVCDTNCDPDVLDWAVPGNDDAARSIRLFCATMADAVIEGRAEAEAAKAAAMQPAEAVHDDQQAMMDAPAEERAPEASTEPVRTEE